MEALERMPFTAQKKIFKRLAEIADSSSLSQEEREKYEESRKVADDWYSGMYGSWISGVKEGESRTKLKIAANLLTMGYEDNAVAKATGLSLEQISRLKN